MNQFIIITFALLALNACGSETAGTVQDQQADSSQTVNTDKLIGTPFEGKETGDEIGWSFFLCNEYRTETVDALPIKIFAAYFTPFEEAIIQEGIDIANQAMGPTHDGGVFYELTDTWSNDVRVIYKVDRVNNEKTGIDYDAAGQSLSVNKGFNGKRYAETVVTDWRIEIVALFNKWTVAHELGHAAGLGHWLIDYENDTFDHDALEEGSLMDIYDRPQKQGVILQSHLGEPGTSVGGSWCDE